MIFEDATVASTNLAIDDVSVRPAHLSIQRAAGVKVLPKSFQIDVLPTSIPELSVTQIEPVIRRITTPCRPQVILSPTFWVFV